MRSCQCQHGNLQLERAGTRVVKASGAETTNFLAASTEQSVTIAKAATVTTVTCGAGPFTYNGSPYTPCSASVTGPGGLNQVLTVNYADNINAGTATASASYTESANYLGSSDSKNFTIAKAATVTTVTFEVGPYMFRGTPFIATAVVTGVGGLNLSVPVIYSGNCTNVTSVNGCTASASYAESANYLGSSDSKSITITTAFAFNGFFSLIGGSEEYKTGGSFAEPVRAFKLGSTIPVKFGATWLNGGAALSTGIHTLQAVKYSDSMDSDAPIDATPTDAATTGNQFRLTSPDWHFNLSAKGFSAGTWLLIATLEDGSKHRVVSTE